MTAILDEYRRADFNDSIEVGTPDPTKYHDARSMQLKGSGGGSMTSRMRFNGKFSLPGVIIPRATRDGASLGVDHEHPMEIRLDPEFTGGNLVVDLDAMRKNPGEVAEAIKRANRGGHTSQGDAIIAAFGEFTKNKRHANQPQPVEAPQPEQRANPYVPPNTYVAPRAPDVLSAPADFTKAARQRPLFVDPEPIQQDTTPRMTSEVALSKQMRSLYAEMAPGPVEKPVVKQQARPMQKVVFEVPNPFDGQKSLGRFVSHYHDVIVDEEQIVLVYDHRQPAQSVYLPEPVEDETGRPLPLAVVLCDTPEGHKLYKACPTGITFKHGPEEFCILKAEFQKILVEG